MQDILHPMVGDKLTYTYRHEPGLMEVTKTTRNKIFFLDSYKHLKKHEVSFGWSTWRVHVEHTLENVAYLHRDPNWEV
jgi:hypothetical protein